mgnify:CR=1 FL=1
MSANALFARVTRTALVVGLLASGFLALPAQAQQHQFHVPAAADTATAASAPTILHITVKGTQRIESATVLSYISLHEGDPYQAQTADLALKALFATGMF